MNFYNKRLPMMILLWLSVCTMLLPSPVALAQTSGDGLHSLQSPGDEFWDDRFGFAGIEGKVNALAVAPNGDLYVGGEFNKAGGLDARNIARWDGRSWHPLGTGVDGSVHAIAVHGTTVYVGGAFNTAGDLDASRLAQWDGENWSPVGTGAGPVDDYFGSPQPGYVYALAVVDSRLYVGGDFVSIDGVAANNIAAWDGQTWSPLGSGVGKLDWEGAFVADGEVLALAPYSDALYVGGDFTQAGGVNANSVAAWNGFEWVALGDGVALGANANGYPAATVAALAVYNGQLHAGGSFEVADGKPTNHLAVWNGATWNSVGGGLRPEQYSSDRVVNALAVSDNRLYVGGSFVAAGGKAMDLLVQWDGATFTEVGDGIQDQNYDIVHALAVGPESSVYIGGSYKFGGNRRIDNVGRYDATGWHALGAGLAAQAYGDTPARPYAIVVAADGSVFAGGEFQYAGGLKVDNLALWDGEAWHNIGGTNGRIRALALAGDDLYVGGEFTQAGGIAANHIARWNRISEEWSALGSGINGDVRALAYSDGKLYAGGGFSAVGNVTAYDVAFWDGAQWHPFGAQARIFERTQEGGEAGTYVNALAVSGDLVFIGGYFQTIQYGTDISDLSSFVVMHNLTAWDSRNDKWLWIGTPLNPGVTKNGFSGFSVDVNALALIGDGLYVGGSFNQAGAIAANNVARYSLATGDWSAPGNSVGGFDDNPVYALATYGTDLFVGGHFTVAGAAQARFVGRLDTLTDSWSTLGSGLKWYNDRFTDVYSVAAAASGVYVGGAFDQAGGRSASGFARWAGPLGGGNVTPGEGGTVNGPEGLTVAFPTGATLNDLIVKLVGLTGPRQSLPVGLAALRSFNGAATTVTGQAVTGFDKPYTLTIPYTDAQLAAAGVTDPATLTVLSWTGAEWQPLLPCTGCNVDTNNRLVTVVADHFSEFALVGQVNNPNLQNSLYLPLVRMD
jgi:trimeric autotransporter adhesin